MGAFDKEHAEKAAAAAIVGPGVEEAREELSAEEEQSKKKLLIQHLHMASLATPFTRRLRVTDKEEGFHYRWVRDDPDAIDRRTEMGFNLVTDETEKARGGEEADKIDNVRRAAGRYVLMRQPQEIHEAYVELQKEKAAKAVHGPREIFKTIAARSGVETEDHTRISRGAPGPAATE